MAKTTKRPEVKDGHIAIYTDGSCIPNPGFGGYGFWATTATHEYSAFGPLGDGATNNQAEVVAVTKALELLPTIKGLKSATIHSDSRYTLDGINRVRVKHKAGWVNREGTPIANKDQWVWLLDALNQNTVPVRYKWVKGHSGVYGNEQADQLADQGRQSPGIHSLETDLIADLTVAESPETKEKPKRVKKPKVVPLHPLLSGKRWFLTANQSNRHSDGNYVYGTTTYKDKLSERNKLAGKRAADTQFSVLLTPSPLTVLDQLSDRFSVVSTTARYPLILDLSTLAKPTIWADVSSPTPDVRIDENLLVTGDDTLLGSIVHPPKLVYTLEETLIGCLMRLDQYREADTELTVYDITEHIFTENAKGKQVMHEDFQVPTKSLKFTTPAFRRKVQLDVGIDLPPRTTFTKLLKLPEHPVITVELITWPEGKHSFRCATIVKYDQDISIHMSKDSNHRLK